MVGGVVASAAQAGATLPNGLTAAADPYPLAGPDHDCPVGTYTVEVAHEIDGTEQFFHAELTVPVTADRQLSVIGSLSESPS